MIISFDRKNLLYHLDFIVDISRVVFTQTGSSHLRRKLINDRLRALNLLREVMVLWSGEHGRERGIASKQQSFVQNARPGYEVGILAGSGVSELGNFNFLE